MEWIFEPVLNAIKDWFYSVLYKFQAGVCYLIDFIKQIFYKLCGLDTVVVDGKNVDLVSSLVQSNTIHRVFLTVMLIGVILLTIFLMIALIRANYQSNERKTRGAIMAKAGQSFLIFLLIPFLLLAGMTLVNAIMASLNSSMQVHIIEGQSAIGGQMLITTGNNAFIGAASEREAIERMFLSGELDYNNLSVVRQYYDITEMNYVIGILGGLVMLVMFVISSITFIQRIFDIKQKIESRNVYSEENMAATIKEYVDNPDYECVNVKFFGRDFYPIKGCGQRQHREKATHGFMICATDEYGEKMFFKKKEPRQLRFTAVTDNARIFGKKEQAQKYLDSLPAVKANLNFSIEEYTAPAIMFQRGFNSEMAAVAE